MIGHNVLNYDTKILTGFPPPHLRLLPGVALLCVLPIRDELLTAEPAPPLDGVRNIFVGDTKFDPVLLIMVLGLLVDEEVTTPASSKTPELLPEFREERPDFRARVARGRSCFSIAAPSKAAFTPPPMAFQVSFPPCTMPVPCSYLLVFEGDVAVAIP